MDLLQRVYMPPMSKRDEEEKPYARMLRQMAKLAATNGNEVHAHNLLNMANLAAGRAEVFGTRRYVKGQRLDFS